MKITVFTTNTCAYCKMLKQYLDNKGKSYEVVNLDDNPERQQEVFDMSGALTVPVTLVEDGDKKSVVVGFNLASLVPVIT